MKKFLIGFVCGLLIFALVSGPISRKIDDTNHIKLSDEQSYGESRSFMWYFFNVSEYHP